ncbi:MAG: hypothetical protein OXF02_04425 [Simkaniaceae bacterium]|nr:hypothetical protein [Simkaniaceae bacterium]
MVRPLEGITQTDPIITRMKHIDPTPVVTSQPVVAPVVRNHIAPAVAVNNVTQGQWGACKKASIFAGCLAGGTLAGTGCTVGAIRGTAEIATQMGATVAVTEGGRCDDGSLGRSLCNRRNGSNSRILYSERME